MKQEKIQRSPGPAEALPSPHTPWGGASDVKSRTKAHRTAATPGDKEPPLPSLRENKPAQGNPSGLRAGAKHAQTPSALLCRPSLGTLFGERATCLPPTKNCLPPARVYASRSVGTDL